MAPKKKILNDYGSLSSDEEAVELPEAPSSSALDRLANRMVGDVDEMSQLLKSSASDASNPNDGHKATTPVKKVLSSKALLIRFAALAFSAIFLVGLLTWTVCSVSKKIHHKALPVPSHARKPFSKLDPVQDLGLYAYERPRSSRPPHPMKGLNSTKNFPTNAWYQNMLMAETPGLEHRAYAIPYIVDAASPIPGLRVHPNHVTASNFVVQMNIIEQYGLTLGAYSKKKSSFDPTYVATHATPLGVTLEWVSLIIYIANHKGKFSIFILKKLSRVIYFSGCLSHVFVDHERNAVCDDALQKTGRGGCQTCHLVTGSLNETSRHRQNQTDVMPRRLREKCLSRGK
jgi:hypothetical protein